MTLEPFFKNPITLPLDTDGLFRKLTPATIWPFAAAEEIAVVEAEAAAEAGVCIVM
ncbi:hypothetical protein D3C76_1486050 [compost metagenome]